jgi:hypothetical protein
MASSDFASPEELQHWTNELSDAAKAYDPAAGPAGIDTRLKMISRAEDIIRGLTDPTFTGHVYVARVSRSITDLASSTPDRLISCGSPWSL